MSEKELDRLNYYNGKRLLASDLKLEQEYHIRVRRWLNKSLYAAGIARGLEVREVPGAPTVVVSPGLALDSDGREIILLDEARVDVLGLASKLPCGGQPGDGSYLTIQYDEEVIDEESDGCCTPMLGGSRNGSSVAWGGPARVRAEPVLQWTDVLPAEGSGQIVLAQVSLVTGCGSVQSVDAGVRRYIGAASAAKVRQYALEGVRDLSSHAEDAEMKERIYFHIRGRQATSVTLYLRAEKMPALYYTELGAHDHTLSVQTHPDGQHRHEIGLHSTATDGSHSHPVADTFGMMSQDWLLNLEGIVVSAVSSKTVHDYKVIVGPHLHYQVGPDDAIIAQGDIPQIVNNDGTLGPLRTGSGGSTHHHAFGDNHELTLANDLNSAHTHNVTSSAAKAGVTGPAGSNEEYTAHGGDPLTYVADLEIWIDGIDQTNNIKQQLQGAIPTEALKWQRIGDGLSTHPLVTNGTRGIKLDFLPGLFFAEGEHSIEFRLAPKTVGTATVPNGGRINYNLYVE